MMNRKAVLLTIVSSGAIVGIAGVASGVASNAERTESNVPAVSDVLAQVHTLASAKGADFDQITPVGTLRNGDTVNVVPTTDGTCVIVVGGNSFATSDLCATPDKIEKGTAATVVNDCTAPRGAMFISAILPRGAAAGALRWSDGTSGAAARSAAGVVWFDATTPVQGERYPVGIQAIDAEGNNLATVSLPVNGSEFCLPNR